MSRAASRLALNGGLPVRDRRLPLHEPWFGAEEIAAATACLRSGDLGGDGPRGKELERLLEEFFAARRVLLVTSCTSALEIALMISGVGPDDEVILPSFTFASTANAVVRAGARPVFVDIEPKNCNIDPSRIQEALTPRTRAILPVHYAGMACSMEAIETIAGKHGLLVIEDAAHAVNAGYRGRPLGAWGPIGCVSFHETKDMVCGEGGALVIRDDEDLASKAEVIREKGTDRSAFMRGERDRYSWVALGGSYVLSDLLAAIALEQFKKVPEITRRKTEHAEFLLERLAPYGSLIRLPVVPEGCRPNWHLFAILVDPAHRDWILRALKAEGIGAAFHYIPLHSAPFALQNPAIPGIQLPVTDRVAASLIRLPLYAAMTPRDRADIVNALDKVLNEVAADV